MMRTLAFAGLMATTVLGLAKPLEQYTFSTEPIVWEVDVFRNGTLYNISGTVEDVYRQVKLINPDFKLDVCPPKLGDGAPGEDTDGYQDTPYALCYTTLHNTYGWGSAVKSVISNGIDYLRGIPGQPQASPGHGVCSRVSCSYDSAIYWCSDHAQAYSLPSYGNISSCAQIAVDSCSFPDYQGQLKVLGQHFAEDSWNCIVRQDDC
ncbi:hypothetical protein V8F20_011964 [Naviculisporaceae sp. PSN 640]